MKTQTTGRKVNSRLWAIPGVKFMFIWNKTGFYVKQRCKHSGKLSGTKYLKCSITIFLKFIWSNSDHAFPKTKFHVQDTKKLKCPSSITLRDIVFFPNFKVRYINCIFSLFFRGFFPLLSSSLAARWILKKNSVTKNCSPEPCCSTSKNY